MSQGSLNPKIRFLGQKMCSVARLRTDRQTDRHTDRQTHRQTHTHTHTYTQTHMKVNTEATLSGFQEFFLQPINKDLSNKGCR